MKGFSFKWQTQQYEVSQETLEEFIEVNREIDFGYQLLHDNKGNPIVVIDLEELKKKYDMLSNLFVIRDIVIDIKTNADDDCEMIFIVANESKNKRSV